MEPLKPRIAIPMPTAGDFAYNQRSWPMYAEAVRRSGGDAVEVALGLSQQELRAIAESCHGVCLPGSPADVTPHLYGEEADPATASADPLRETCDFFLLEHAQDTGRPVLAICYGVQSMNVWRGGSLVQDVAPVPVNHSAGSQVAVAHSVLVASESLLGQVLLQTEDSRNEAPKEAGYLRLPVNTSHHQAVASPGDGLRVAARCPEDGVIEAIEGDPEFPRTEDAGKSAPFLLGVQWHPERSFDISAASRTLFLRLIEEAADFIEREPRE